MTRAEAVTAVGRDRREVGQHAVFDAKEPQRARIFGFVFLGVVAAVDQHDGAGRRCRHHLVRIDAECESVALFYFRPDAAVCIDLVDGDTGLRQVVAAQQMGCVGGQADMHRACAKRHGFAVEREFAVRRIDVQRADLIKVSLHAFAAVAGCHVQMFFRRMRPCVLNHRGHVDGFALRERQRIDVNVVMSQLFADGTV